MAPATMTSKGCFLKNANGINNNKNKIIAFTSKTLKTNDNSSFLNKVELTKLKQINVNKAQDAGLNPLKIEHNNSEFLNLLNNLAAIITKTNGAKIIPNVAKKEPIKPAEV